MNKTTTELIREHLLSTLGFFKSKKAPDLKALRSKYIETEFKQLMLNRRVMGFFRYKDIGKHDYIEAIERKIKAFKKDGNLEHMVDIANYANLEFNNSNHPLAHFKAIDDGTHAKEI